MGVVQAFVCTYIHTVLLLYLVHTIREGMILHKTFALQFKQSCVLCHAVEARAINGSRGNNAWSLKVIG